MSNTRAQSYFLKSVGLASDPLPARWWDERPEILDGVYFNREPKALGPGVTLIYYAVGGDGRLCGVAAVTGEATREFKPPARWTPEIRKKFQWRMPVRVMSKCAADANAPRLADFHDKRIGAGAYQWLDDEKAQRIIPAIAACEAKCQMKGVK